MKEIDKDTAPPQAAPSAEIKEFPDERVAVRQHESKAGSSQQNGFLRWLARLTGKDKPGSDLREVLEEFIEEVENSDDGPVSAIARHEHTLMSNVLKLRDMTVVDVMIPRADIVAIDIGTSQEDLLSLLAEKQHSRIPVYRDSLDDILGTIHIKDIMACMAKGNTVEVENLVREAPIVSPSMPVLDLILMMKHMKKHMALVVDEYGGIDGLVTIGDVIETIIGEIDDEYDTVADPELKHNKDGSVLADGRYDIESFEEEYGGMLTADEREDIDTLGGLVFELARRIPARGEILTHSSGMVLEVIEADPRRVNKVLIRNIPTTTKDR